MNLKEGYFEGKDGLPIFYSCDIPHTSSAIIIIAHGFMEHSGRYIEFADHLVSNGYGVCLLDHRGHGRSKGTRGDIDDFFDFVVDMKCLVKLLENYDKPILTYGHSMGGLITFLYGLEYPTDLVGQVFASPALAPPKVCTYLPTQFYEMMGSKFPQVKIKRGGINVAVKSPNFKKQFRQDAMVNKYSTARFFDQFLRKGMAYAHDNAAKYNIPSFFLVAGKDYVIPVSGTNSIIDSISNFKKTTKLYSNCMHDLLHDESNYVKEVIDDVLKWLDKMLDKEVTLQDIVNNHFSYTTAQ